MYCFDCASSSSGAHAFMAGRPLCRSSGDTSTVPLKRTGATVESWRIAAGRAIRVAAHCSAGRRWRTRAFRPVISGAELYEGHRQCQSPSATSLGVVEDMCVYERPQNSARLFGNAPSFWSIQLDSTTTIPYLSRFVIHFNTTCSSSSHKLRLMSSCYSGYTACLQCMGILCLMIFCSRCRCCAPLRHRTYSLICFKARRPPSLSRQGQA